MSLSDKRVEVQWVMPVQLGDAVRAFAYYLLRGMRAADYSMAQLIEELVSGRSMLGVAYEVEPFRPLGAWASDIREGDGRRWATVYALSGERLPAWMPRIEALVVAWARANDCDSVRFFGRVAYTMLIEDLEIIGKSEDGRALLFEKKIAA